MAKPDMGFHLAGPARPARPVARLPSPDGRSRRNGLCDVDKVKKLAEEHGIQEQDLKEQWFSRRPRPGRG